MSHGKQKPQTMRVRGQGNNERAGSGTGDNLPQSTPDVNLQANIELEQQNLDATAETIIALYLRQPSRPSNDALAVFRDLPAWVNPDAAHRLQQVVQAMQNGQHPPDVRVADIEIMSDDTWDGLAHEAREYGLSRQLYEAHLASNTRAVVEIDQMLRELRGRQVKQQDIIWDRPANVRDMLATQPPPMQWLIQDNIPLGRGIILTGLGGSSKTRLLYQLAMGAALGELPWGWKIGTRGKSVLVLTEDTHDDVHRTLHALCTSIALEPDQLQHIYNSIIVYPLAGTDVRLLNFGQGRELIKTDLFNQLEDKIKSIGGVAFVGLDPALSLTAGDEQDQGHQRALGKMADDLGVNTGATVALVTHATKASLNQDELTSHASRGGGGITDAARGEFAMRTMTAQEASKAGITEIEERKRHVQLVGTKGNMLPPAAYVPVWLRRDNNGTLVGADISLEPSNGPTSTDLNVLDVLFELSKQHTPTLQEWRFECAQRGILAAKSDAALVQKMKRTLERLRKAGLIQPGHGRGIWIPTQS